MSNTFPFRPPIVLRGQFPPRPPLLLHDPNQRPPSFMHPPPPFPPPPFLPPPNLPFPPPHPSSIAFVRTNSPLDLNIYSHPPQILPFRYPPNEVIQYNRGSETSKPLLQNNDGNKTDYSMIDKRYPAQNSRPLLHEGHLANFSHPPPSFDSRFLRMPIPPPPSRHLFGVGEARPNQLVPDFSLNKHDSPSSSNFIRKITNDSYKNVIPKSKSDLNLREFERSKNYSDRRSVEAFKKHPRDDICKTNRRSNDVYEPARKHFKSSEDHKFSKRIPDNKQYAKAEDKVVKEGEGNDNDDEKRIEAEAREWETLLENYEEEKIPDWVRCSPADLCFKRNNETNVVESTKRMQDLERKFENELLKRTERIRATRPPVVMPERITKKYGTKKKLSDKKKDKNVECNSENKDVNEEDEDEDEDEGDEDDDDDVDDETKGKMNIIEWKNKHPEKLHDEMWFNLPGEMNDGPLCRCTRKTKLHGIRHDIYPGEQEIKRCQPHSCNSGLLHHYKITMSPHTNFLTRNPTLITYDSHEYIFEGFSLFSHYKISKVPTCKVIRFNIEYTIHWLEEDMIENFDIKSLDLFSDFLYGDILELVDLDWLRKDVESSSCRCFHLMPRFSRSLPDNGKEILSMNEVLNFLLKSNRPLVDEIQLGEMLCTTDHEWQDFVDEVRGMIVTYPGMRPSSLRIDQLDRTQEVDDVIRYPKIIHFGYRPAQLSYVGDAVYSKLFKQYMKLKYLVANKPKLSVKDRDKLRTLENQLQEIRLKGSLKREMTVEISSEGFMRTGLKSDICQHALLLPVLLQHLRFHKCLDVLETNIEYHFKDRLFLQMAMTHPSFRMNYGTNPDHARNSLTNCGMRQLEYGDRHIHYIHTRKRGIKTLMHIMSKMARSKETASEIHHYERLEFLGDTVIEFLSSIHLFFLFPRLEEGGLATYRAALVQNQHLTVLAQKLGLQHFLLYAHGPDLCRDLDLRYALANCFEALMGSLFLDGGIEVADKIFGEALFKDEPHLLYVWTNLPAHPLQVDEPLGDRHWVEKSKPLQKIVEFEKTSGFQFNHIRLLARALTMRNIGFNNLTLGHNQTLEFLGDTILQFITSEYLFKHFPDHHEGHLTLLRSSLVNNKTQAIICDDLGMTEYVINNDPKVRERMENEKNKVKDKADILEAFIGALYVDQGLDPCIVFCQVCFYPRLKEFIMNQEWNDAKSQLQQCCLTLRDPTDGEPDIPIYKVLQCTGPTNTRKYHIAVYFRGERLATGVGHSIQQGEMEAATNALKEKSDMFPHLLQTKQYLDWRFGRYFKDQSSVDKKSKDSDDD